MGPKIDQKSIKKRSQNRSAFLDRFLVDLGSILGGFWEPKSTKNRSKKPSKKRTSKRCPRVTLSNPEKLKGGPIWSLKMEDGGWKMGDGRWNMKDLQAMKRSSDPLSTARGCSVAILFIESRRPMTSTEVDQPAQELAKILKECKRTQLDEGQRRKISERGW